MTAIDDLVHFTLREWSRLAQSVTESEVERAKAQLKASLLLSLDGTTAVAEDIGRQIITTGRRMNPAEIERVVGAITEKDVVAFANERIWDQDIAVSALGSIEGVSHYSPSFTSIPVVVVTDRCAQLLDYQRIRNDTSRNF